MTTGSLRQMSMQNVEILNNNELVHTNIRKLYKLYKIIVVILL